MMDNANIWSQYIQSSEELYASREVRFRADNKDLWLDAMKIKDSMNVLEIGCGSGVFCHRIKEFLPNAAVTGLDRDIGHIRFAQAKTKELSLDCGFIFGDALNLPFDDNTFDACTSHTVIEHVETDKFLGEQYRVLKNGGVISVLSVRSRLSIFLDLLPDGSQEAALLNKAWEKADSFDKEHGIGAFDLDEKELPAALVNAGFSRVNVHFISDVRYAPDNADVSDELAMQQINVNRISLLSSMKKALNRSPDALSENEAAHFAKLINQRFDDRIERYLSGDKIWDIATGTVMAVTGYK